MFGLDLTHRSGITTLLCLGAHCDDIEICCGAGLLTLLSANPQLTVHWVVLSSSARRRREAEASAADFLAGASRRQIEINDFRNGFFPYVGSDIKAYMEDLKARVQPDLILCHARGDLHQDHRTVGELAWQTFRNHWILEYEIPKYDGDLGRPNVYIPTTADLCERKIQLILQHFPSQADKHWFTADTFRSLMRLRGIECASPSGYAEAFYGSKLILTASVDQPA
jgi:LmbE family N-acetylglucosaminyl deacetylase